MKTENNWENMNDEQFAEVVKAWPWYALKYPHVATPTYERGAIC